MGPWQPFERPGGRYDGNYVGGADEGRAAYIMVALLDAETNEVIPGHVSAPKRLSRRSFSWPALSVGTTVLAAQRRLSSCGQEPERCLMTNVTGLALPIAWGAPTAPPTPQPPLPAPVKVPAGKSVRLRMLFRDATIFAVGASD